MFLSLPCNFKKFWNLSFSLQFLFSWNFFTGFIALSCTFCCPESRSYYLCSPDVSLLHCCFTPSETVLLYVLPVMLTKSEVLGTLPFLALLVRYVIVRKLWLSMIASSAGKEYYVATYWWLTMQTEVSMQTLATCEQWYGFPKASHMFKKAISSLLFQQRKKQLL